MKFVKIEFTKKELIETNKEFGGNISREGSLEYALSAQKHKKYGDYKKLAYLWRAILIDHPFTDGNKRTALWASLKFAEKNNKKADTDKLNKLIIKIAKENIHNIAKIERSLRNAIR
ncbi:MAG: Fic family protein [Nanoarchaeota archaeon]|nr:Fic family protein [Nanoarchaeota archaeon]